ncbi:MAG: chemotaxis protein CheD [Thermodesulfobacteriota bacterium]|nr:chemotaxis protein CheD [Thermodesulfobacteriota bacterium]
MSRGSSIISTVLGSCVAVSLWESKKNYGGMVHYLYPTTIDKKRGATARYGDAAVSYLIKMFLEEEAADKKSIRAQIFGGASLQSVKCMEIAEENIGIARLVLERFNVKIVSEDVGGAVGRKLVYNTFSNEAVVYKTVKLRHGDWYPYINT